MLPKLIPICCLTILLAAANIQQALTLNSVLDINGTFPYLIDNSTGQITEPRNYMDFENIYAPNETYRFQQTAQGRNYHLLKAFDFANYFQSDYWHYSSKEDLRLSAFPVANADRCEQQLNWIERQLNNSQEVLFKPGEQHVNLMALIDSYGKPEANTYLGHGYWLGSHYECTRIQLDLDKFEQEECRQRQQPANCSSKQFAESSSSPLSLGKLVKTRYCIGKARDKDWPNEEQDNYKPVISYKIGLCLPESCETLSFGKHRAQIERLMRFQMPNYLKQRVHLNDMYCLPDRRSPIRALSFSARVFLTICISWLLILIAATSVHSCYRRHQKDLRNIMLASQQARQELGMSQQHELETEAKLKLSGAKVDSFSCHSQAKSNDNNNCTIALNIDTANGMSHANGQSSSPIIGACANGCCNSPSSLLTNHQQGDEQDRASLYLAHYVVRAPEASEKVASESANVKGILTNGAQLLTTLKLHNGGQTLNHSSLQHHHRQHLANAANAIDLSDDRRSNSSYQSNSSSLSSWLNESPFIIKLLEALSISENVKEFQRPPLLLRTPKADRKLRINLNALDSIKCLCCILVIFGHIVFIHMQHLSNIIHTIELSHEIAPRVLIAFFNFVDTFFIISGMLTAYFIFKRFNKKSFARPQVWFGISLLRILRLSPVYILTFWFIKTLSVHLSEGPIWDYGTDKNSIKGLCINDHWWKSILYLGNVGTMQPLCILPAWSIIVDAQYSLIIPPIIFLIFKHKRLGYVTLLIAIIVSTANMSLQLATQTAVKTSDMAKVRLHVYPLISRFAAEFYNTAWNRIGPVAIGILGGHLLYLYDVGTIRRWPWFMRNTAFKFVLFMHLVIFLLPTVGRLTDDPASSPQQTDSSSSSSSSDMETDMTIFILSNATIKPIWSLINTIFLLRLITDLRRTSVLARLMSHNIWHCLGKLCFASYLMHYEIILVLLKSRQEGLVDPNWSNVAREFSLAFLISTLLSYFVYILFEAPINKLISLAMVKPSYSASQTINNSSNDSEDEEEGGGGGGGGSDSKRRNGNEMLEIVEEDFDERHSAPKAANYQKHRHLDNHHERVYGA